MAINNISEDLKFHYHFKHYPNKSLDQNESSPHRRGCFRNDLFSNMPNIFLGHPGGLFLLRLLETLYVLLTPPPRERGPKNWTEKSVIGVVHRIRLVDPEELWFVFRQGYEIPLFFKDFEANQASYSTAIRNSFPSGKLW